MKLLESRKKCNIMQYMPKQSKDLIKELEEYRLDHKITLQELAKILEVNYTTIYRWMSGKTEPNKIQTHQIKKLLEK